MSDIIIKTSVKVEYMYTFSVYYKPIENCDVKFT